MDSPPPPPPMDLSMDALFELNQLLAYLRSSCVRMSVFVCVCVNLSRIVLAFRQL